MLYFSPLAHYLSWNLLHPYMPLICHIVGENKPAVLSDHLVYLTEKYIYEIKNLNYNY